MRTNAYSMSTRIRSLLSFAPILQVPRRYAFRSKVPCSPTRCSSTIRNVSVTAECCHPIYSITRSPSVDCAVDIAKRAAHNINSYLANTPVPEHTLVAFQHFLHWRSRPTATPTFILDACCGTGRSSFLLARLSGCDVVGVDKSVARLSRNRVFREGEVNADHTTLLLRGNMEHFWRLLYEHNIAPSQTFLLYPNPYPKSSQIKKRWHAHPIFPLLVSLSGRFEIRASWPAYLEEFRAAHTAVLSCGAQLPVPAYAHMSEVREIQDVCPTAEDISSQPLSNFEAKYVAAKQPIYRLIINAAIEESDAGSNPKS